MVGAGCTGAAARVESTADALEALRMIFTAEEPLAVTLDRVAHGAAYAIPDADAVTITVLTRDEPGTAAWTDTHYLDIDKRQYLADRGPCLHAARSRRPVRASAGDHRDQWPEFSAVAESAGIRAYLSMPLLVQGGKYRDAELVGSINVYSKIVAAFDELDEALLGLFTTVVTQAISNARHWHQSRTQVRHLRIALDARAEIDQAKGIVMAVRRCSADEAFSKLMEQSQRRNVKVGRIARELLDASTRQKPQTVMPLTADENGPAEVEVVDPAELIDALEGPAGASRLFPIRPTPVADARFSPELAKDVLKVLRSHGYPDAHDSAGDYVEMREVLFNFLYGRQIVELQR
jgi:GAF domain-containing protein